MLVDGHVIYSGAPQAAIGEIDIGNSGPSWRPAWTGYFDDFEFDPGFVVTTLADDGPGSLRSVIGEVNSHPTTSGPDQIIFASDISGGTISLQSSLPARNRTRSPSPVRSRWTAVRRAETAWTSPAAKTAFKT